MVRSTQTLHTTWQDRNESLFYHVLTENIEELLPIVHMPTVSQYCQTYGLMFKSLPRSLFISIRDRGAPRGPAVGLHRVLMGFPGAAHNLPPGLLRSLPISGHGKVAPLDKYCRCHRQAVARVASGCFCT